MKELLLFQAGNIQFGLNLPLVKSIHNVNARIEEQAGRSHKLLQVMDGEEFPLYDLPSILGDVTSSGDPMSQKVILVEAHEHPIALGVDRVERVVSVNSDRIQPLPPIFKGLSLSCFPQVLKHEDELILLLNPEGIRNCNPEMPDTETYTPKPEAMESSLEEKETPKPMTRAASDINEIPQDSGQKSEVANGEPASNIPYSESTPPVEIEKNQSDLDDCPSETIDIDPDLEEKTTSLFVKEARVPLDELPQQELIKPEESTLSGEQEQVGPELSVMDAGLEETTPDTEDSDAHDTEEIAAAADVDDTASETSKESFQLKESILSDEQEQIGPELSAMDASLEETTPDTQDSDAHDTEEKAAAADVDESAPEISLDKDEVDTSVENGHFEAAGLDHSNSANEDKDMPFLPVGDVPYLFAAVSTESEPISIKPAEIVSLKETIAALEIPKPESTDPFRSAKEDKDMPLLPVGDVPYLFAAVSTESEPISIKPAEIVSLRETEAALETPEPESTDHLPSAEEDKAVPLQPVREVPYLLDAVSTESEPITTEPDDFILSDSSDTIKSAYGNQSKRALTPSQIPQKLELDYGKRKSLRQGVVAVGMLALVALLSLSMWQWLMSASSIPEVVIKPMPLFYKIREVREKPEELSQIPQPLNTGKNATDTAHPLLKAGAEVFRIETNDFTLTVERPKNGQPWASVDMTGENEHSHIVMKDDTLWQIAKLYLGDPFRYPELAKTSRISNPDQIFPGDVVRIIKKNERQEGKEGKSLQERSKDGNR